MNEVVQTLRQQIDTISDDVFNEHFTRVSLIDTKLLRLCAEAFIQQWPHTTIYCRILRRAEELLRVTGRIDDTEEGIR